MDEKLKKALADIVGKDNVTDAIIDLVSYSTDFSEHEHRPEGAVWPVTTEQVSRIMQLCDRSGIPVTPRGAGTGATGMAGAKCSPPLVLRKDTLARNTVLPNCSIVTCLCAMVRPVKCGSTRNNIGSSVFPGRKKLP